MANIEFTDNSLLVLSGMERAIYNALDEIGDTAEGYAKELSPVDTGRLRNSISHAVDEEEKAAYIGTNVEYASYVEYGTSRQTAQPFLKPAATEHPAEYERIMKAAMESAE